MGENDKERTKLKLTYINFFSQPKIKDRNTKLLKYSPFFDFLFLLKDRFEIQVIDHIGISETFMKDGIRFHYFKKKNNKQSFPFKAFFQLRRTQPDVVYVQGLSYPHFIILMRLFLKPSTRILVHDHANSIPVRWKSMIFKMADSLIDNYFFTSKSLANSWIKMGIISSDEKIIECVEGSTQFTFDDSINKDENSFLWVGRLDINKDPLTVIRAFSDYIEIKPNAKLTMFYEDTTLLNDIEVFLHEKKLDNNIRLMGALPNEKLESWYQRSTYFILGSHKEGGPLSLIEAMACGCIPIVTNIPAFQGMVDQGDCGFLFEPGDELQLAQILKKLDDIDLESIRKKVLHRFEKELSHKSIASKIEYASTHSSRL